MVDVKISCRSCGKKGSMDNMKYDPEIRKNLICPECFASKAARLEKGSKVKNSLLGMQEKRAVKTLEKPAPVREKLMADMGIKNIVSDKVGYVCGSCKYSFSRNKSFPLNGICPNCGKQALQKRHVVHHDWVKDLGE